MKPITRKLLADFALTFGAGIVGMWFFTLNEWLAVIAVYTCVHVFNGVLYVRAMHLNIDIMDNVMKRYGHWMSLDQGTGFIDMLNEARRTDPWSLDPTDGFRLYWRHLKLRRAVKQEFPY